jgi:hypothetical protein
MIQRYLFISVVVTLLGSLALWSRHLESKTTHTYLAQKSPDLKLIEPRRGLASVETTSEIQSSSSQELEIEALDSK